MLRVAPRVVFTSGKMSFGFELEYSAVNYGTKFTKNSKVDEYVTADNIKALASFSYNF